MEELLEKIENHPTFKRLMGCNDRPTVQDGENLLVLLSVVRDDLKGLIKEGE